MSPSDGQYRLWGVDRAALLSGGGRRPAAGWLCPALAAVGGGQWPRSGVMLLPLGDHGLLIEHHVARRLRVLLAPCGENARPQRRAALDAEIRRPRPVRLPPPAAQRTLAPLGGGRVLDVDDSGTFRVGRVHRLRAGRS